MPPELAATQNIALAAEDLAETSERRLTPYDTAVAKALWSLAAMPFSGTPLRCLHWLSYCASESPL